MENNITRKRHDILWCSCRLTLLVLTAMLLFLYLTDLHAVDTVISRLPAGPCAGETINVTITWVNTSDPLWRKAAVENGCSSKMEKAIATGGDTDPFDAIRYGMRSIYKNMPFVDTIFIITALPSQVPSWLNVEHPKIKLLHHDAIMGFTAFNGRTVESYAGKFLADTCYINMNDDFLVMRPMTREDYFPNGYLRADPYVHVDLGFSMLPFIDVGYSVYDLWRKVSNVSGRFVTSHVPVAVHRNTFEDFCANDAKCLYCREPKHKCDDGEISYGRYDQYIVENTTLGRWSMWNQIVDRVKIGIGLPQIPISLGLVLAGGATHAYIESHNGLSSKPDWVGAIRQFLQTQFPDAAPWEFAKNT